MAEIVTTTKMKDIKEVMRLPRFLRNLAMTEGLKLTIFTYKWGKYVKLGCDKEPSPVTKYLNLFCKHRLTSPGRILPRDEQTKRKAYLRFPEDVRSYISL